MKKFLVLLLSVVALIADAAFAASDGYEQKTVLENERIRVVLVTVKPGAESPSVVRQLDRLVYAVTAGTLQRVYSDGKTEIVKYEAGDSIFSDQPEDKKKYLVKNIGESTVILQITFIK